MRSSLIEDLLQQGMPALFNGLISQEGGNERLKLKIELWPDLLQRVLEGIRIHDPHRTLGLGALSRTLRAPLRRQHSRARSRVHRRDQSRPASRLCLSWHSAR